MNNIPEKIYLQIDADGETPEDFKELAGISWASERIHPNDIEYTIANELYALKEAVKNLIYGHRAFITFDSDEDGLKYKTALENVKKLITN